MPEPLFVGIDPGNTSAVAAVNLDGELRLLESDRELPRHEIIRMIIDTGKPVVVACDTGKMPSTVEKIASSLGAEKFEPEEDLERQRKEDLGEGENSHEKDAAASAFHAYNSMRREVKKIKKFQSETDKELDEVAESYFSRDFSRMKQKN
jgi:predicted RNase H-like nuclease (RuvC/YqgF family)